MKSIYLFSFLLLLFLASCNTVKPVVQEQQVNNPSECSIKAIMLDYTSNENCQYLFKLEDGSKLLPASMPNVNIPFIDGKTVLIAYSEIDASVRRTGTECGAEDKIVRVTCIKEYADPTDNTPKTHQDCEPIKNPFASFWMRPIIEEIKPQKIFEYPYTLGYIYSFKKDEHNYLYDCLGNKMCDTQDSGDCNSLINTLGDAKLIQVLNN